MGILSVGFTGANADSIGIGTPTLLKPDYRVMGPDAIGIADAKSLIVTYARAASDAIGLSDSFLSKSDALRLVTDAIAYADTPARQSDALRIVTDAVAYADTPARHSDALRIMSDAIGIADTAVFQTDTRRAVVDAIGIADSIQKIVDYLRIVLDGVALGDTFQVQAFGPSGTTWLVSVADSVGLSTSHVLSPIYSRSVTDAVGLSTAASASSVYARIIADSIAIDPSISDHNLIANFPFTEGSGATVTDTQNGVVGTFTGGVSWSVDGTRGTVLDLNGTTGFITLDNEPLIDFGDYMTISAWVKPDTTTSKAIVTKYNGVHGWIFTMSTAIAAGGIRFVVTMPGASLDVTALTALTIGSWNHVVSVYNKDLVGPAKIALYVDGLAVATNSSSSGTVTDFANVNNEPVLIGKRSDTGQFFDGMIDDVQIYRTALSANEVAALFLKPVNTPYSTPDVQVQTEYLRLVLDGFGIADVLVHSVVYARLITDALGLSDIVIVVSGVRENLWIVAVDGYAAGAMAAEGYAAGPIAAQGGG